VGADADLVLQALGALRERDMDTLTGLVAEDFVWHVPGASPIAGDVTGVQAWTEKMHRLIDAGLRPEVRAVLEGPGHVALLQRNTAQVAGHALDVQVVNVFAVAEGRLRRMDTYFGDQAALDAFWTAVLGDAR
jgi:uncharacterized protein